MSLPDNIYKSFKGIIPRFKYLLLALGEYFGGLLTDLWKFFKKNYKKKKNKTELVAFIITIIICIYIIGSSFYTTYIRCEKIIHKSYYEKVLLSNYETEIRNFFEKYNERLEAKDCGFMKEVGADEAMYEKYGRTSYGDDYNCESFRTNKNKKLIPYKIGEIRRTDNKYRVEGEIITIIKDMKGNIKVGLSEFELWKELDRPLRHFGGISKENGPIKIDFEKIY